MKSRPCRVWRCPPHQARVGGSARGRYDGGDVVSTGPTTLPDQRRRRTASGAPPAPAAGCAHPFQARPDPGRTGCCGARVWRRSGSSPSAEEAVDATQIRSLTALSIDVSALAQDLHKERMAAAALPGQRRRPSPTPTTCGSAATDARIDCLPGRRAADLGDVPAAVRDRLDGDRRPPARRSTRTRQEVLDRRQMPVAEATLRYGVILTDLVSLRRRAGPAARRGELCRTPAARWPRSPGPRRPSPRRRRSPTPRCRADGSTRSSSPPSWPP